MYKSLLCTCSTLFRVHFFAVVLHDLQCETSWLHVLWRKYRTCFCSFFRLPPIFTLVAASISYFPKRRYKIFMLFFQQKNFPLYFISSSSCLSLFFSLSFAGLSPTFSFSVPLSVLQVCRHDK